MKKIMLLLALLAASVSLILSGSINTAQAAIGDNDDDTVDYSAIEGATPSGPTWGGVTYALHDAVIKNNSGSNYTMTICHNWSGNNNGVQPNCSSGIGYLSPGQNSKTKYGWKDTDGILNVTNGRCLYNLSNNRVKSGNSDNEKNDFKVSGFYGATFNYRLDPCS